MSSLFQSLGHKNGVTPISPTPVSPTPVSPMICPVSPTPISPTPVSPTLKSEVCPVSPTHHQTGQCLAKNRNS